MSNTQLLITFSLLFLIPLSFAQKIKYLNGIQENERCELDQGIYGICRKISDCTSQYNAYRRKHVTLIVCSFGETPGLNVICCPQNPETSTDSNFGDRIKLIQTPQDVPDLLDFQVCRKEFLKYRNSSINPNHFAIAMQSGKIPTDKKNCDRLQALNKMKTGENFWDLISYKCTFQNGNYSIVGVGALYAILVERGDRPNMAAIGWKRPNGSVEYKCGGSIITDRFIVTAAHCKFHDGVEANTVRLGDRFLLTSEDDDIAQQVRIEKFILHPDYKSKYHYNDIGLIKTVEKIHFNKFVNPSCIDDLDSERKGHFSDWTVAGYGQTEDRVQSNVLLELKVNLASYEECNKTYEHDPSLPYGILESQFCVKSQGVGGKIPDTCFGDSGSPLQFKTIHEVFDDNFNATYISTVYQSSTVLGIVSFGLDCGFNVPSVYTKLAYYKNWMRSVIKYY